MNFFKQIECNFKKDSEGKTVFFPWSYLGRGYSIENLECGLRSDLRYL